MSGHVVNSQLLQITQSVDEYKSAEAQLFSLHPEPFLKSLPTYMFARCPYCGTANREGLNTYSLAGWHLGYGQSLFDSRLIVHHCEHFALVQPFINFHGIWPVQARGQLGPEVPHVIGHLLEGEQALAVIHAVPICQVEGHSFIPRFTLFMMSYFSLDPEKAYEAAKSFSLEFVEPGVVWLFVEPPAGNDHWWNLSHWVASKRLFWIDASDPALPLHTTDIGGFPYSQIQGRMRPYIHVFPYPIAKASAK